MKPRDIYTRLEKLEAVLKRDPIQCLCEMPNGETEVLTVPEMFKAGAGFIKVVAGSDPDDLFMILEAVQKEAESMDFSDLENDSIDPE